MKISTLMLAGLITLSSAAAFAEGGAERSKQFYQDFNFAQAQQHNVEQRTAAADGKSPVSDTSVQRDVEQQPNS